MRNPEEGVLKLGERLEMGEGKGKGDSDHEGKEDEDFRLVGCFQDSGL